MKRRVAFLDVFAERPLAGNGLAVVEDADGLSDETMLAFAVETRLSETTFLQTPSEDGADYRNRIWTPGEEMPFAGHPSLGTAVAVARWRGDEEASLVQQTHAGLQPIEVRLDGEADGGAERWRATMLQEPAEFGEELDRGAAMRAVGLDAGDAHPELAPRLISAGVWHAIAPLADPGALERAVPDYPAIDALLSPGDAVVIYLAWVDPDSGRGRARSFARILPLGEDPATGSAVGPLCAYLAERTGLDAVTVEQGVEMGRPSLLEAEMERGRPRVSGAVLPLIEGTVVLALTGRRSGILPPCTTATRSSSGPGSRAWRRRASWSGRGWTCGCWRRATASAGARSTTRSGSAPMTWSSSAGSGSARPSTR